MAPILPDAPLGIPLVNPASLDHSKPVVLFELFLDLTCPFCKKLYGTVYDNVLPGVQGKNVQFLVQPTIQPWHPQNTILMEGGLVLLETRGAQAFGRYCRELYELLPGPFQDIDTYDKTRTQICHDLADVVGKLFPDFNREEFIKLLAHTPKAEGERNAGSSVIQRLKWYTRYHRTRGVHVTPTVHMNGLEASHIASSFTTEQWNETIDTAIAAIAKAPLKF